jgi:hypothetical protein
MPVTKDIVATYRGPRRVVKRLLDMGQREDRALAIVMAACVLVFVSTLPQIAREAHLSGQELNMMMGGALMAWVIMAPLLLYIIAALSHLIAKVFGGKGDWFGARLALFWALLASTPVILLYGMVAGLIGPGPSLDAVGIFWCAIFGWFWIGGLIQAESRTQEG